MMRPFFVGVGGGTASGKSTFCRELVERMPDGSVSVLLLDYYYRPQTHLSLDERAQLNFDHPDAFEFPLLSEHLSQLHRGQSVDAPTYDFATHDRTAKTVRIDPTPVVIVEGILVLHREEVSERMDLTVFVAAPDEVRFERRLARDVRERGRTPQSVHDQWQGSVHPMHRAFCEPSRARAHHVVDGTELGRGEIERFMRVLEATRKGGGQAAPITGKKIAITREE